MTLIQDELDIRRALALYCHLCDDREFDALAGQFAPDGRFAFGTAEPVERTDIQAWFESNNPPEQAGKHLTMNAVCEVSRPRAAVTSDFVFLQQREGAIVPVVAGRYGDQFEYSGGKWLIKHRVVAVQMLEKATKPQREK